MSRARRLRDGALALGLAGLLATAGASAAQAHDVLVSTDPDDGSTVDAAPGTVSLTFDQPALAVGTQIDVFTPDGTDVSVGDAQVVDNVVSQDVGGTLPAGDYTVQWRVVSADGHPIDGEFSFTASKDTSVAAPAASGGPSRAPEAAGSSASAGAGGASVDSAADAASSGAPVVLLSILGVVVVLGAAVVVLAVRRQGRGGA
ncbi:copper resistance CopC family protein [Cellulomonas sp. PhB143]|uniref:copper resistance CopC family protein n=1 Tax=Cellulomonas sp. PhB143 TaxID=2485186 RepID=UPI000F49EA0C|nr:copper resistance CopC family protein [Cellulomonas sp. PhB143]ROS75373.1 hypothetical protein EDF32_1782 [Cellulomonas sp. PhB143]